MTMIHATKAMFETEPCTRCGGSGHYSRCQAYGTTCFQCGGRGDALTKRGQAAQAYYRNLCSIHARELQVGMMILRDGTRSAVVFVGYREGDPSFHVETTRCDYHTGEDTVFRLVQSPEAQAQKIALALTYQASLTKQGKPAKR